VALAREQPGLSQASRQELPRPTSGAS
jgi:hypothetical protein